MDTGNLVDHLKMRMTQMGLPLLVDRALIVYINNSYQKFISMMGGVPDEEVLVVDDGAITVAIPTYILKIKSAQRQADAAFVDVINRNDTRNNQISTQIGVAGEIKYILIGTKEGEIKVVYSPLVDTNVVLDIDRLPKVTLSLRSDDPVDVAEMWRLNILDGVIAQLMRMNVDPSMRAKALEFEAMFIASAASARKEKERLKSKRTRTVQYGGIP